jgi:C-terminal processing protease CtpA/Prc
VDTLDGGIVWVRLNDFDDPDLARDFDRAFPDFARVSGLVLDVRRNADAATAAPGHEILARLVSRPFVTVQWRAPRWHALTAEVDWELGVPDTVPPRADRPIYTGPLAALAGLGTAGAAEDFLVAYRGAARGPVVGERTAGRGGRSVMVELPRGWRFEVCATRHAFADGAEFVGTGIAPEQRAPATVADLLEGRDAALARARDYLAERAVSGP